MASLTRFLYHAARLSNKITMYSQAASGHPAHLVKHLRNRLYMKALGRFFR